MKSFITVLVLTGLIATLSPAVAESDFATVYKVSKVEFKEKAQWHSIKMKKRIHRIKTKEEFEKLGGKKTHVDFATYDLVIVNGFLDCAKGEVEALVEKKGIVLTVRIKERCTHRTEALHHTPYIGYFAVIKNAVLVDKTDSPRPPSPITTLQGN